MGLETVRSGEPAQPLTTILDVEAMSSAPAPWLELRRFACAAAFVIQLPQYCPHLPLKSKASTSGKAIAAPKSESSFFRDGKRVGSCCRYLR
jgi:hypothetical protein